MALLSSVLRNDPLTPDLLPEPLEFAIVESAAEIRFVNFSEDCIGWLGFPQGVAFGRCGEFRWRRRAAGACHGVYLSDLGKALAGSTTTLPLTLVANQGIPKRVLLRGRRVDDALREGRIPKVLAYPFAVPPGRLPALLLAHYETTPGGPVSHVRFVAPDFSVADGANER